MRPRWGQIREFCRRQGYRETRTDHIRYLKVLADRSTSGTMVSLGADADHLPAQRWLLVWKHQLRLAGEDEFWKGLRGEPVQYALSVEPDPARPLSPHLASFLANVLHRTEAKIAVLTRQAAQQLWDEFYSRELREP